MAAYPRTQTVVIFSVSTVVVIAVAVYVYGGSFLNIFKSKTPKMADTEVISGIPKDQLVETASWKDTFFNVTDENNSYNTATAKNTSSVKNSEPVTATDIFGREFFSKFMTLRQAGMISNSDAQEALVKQIVDSGQLIIDGPKVYTVADLHIATNEDNASRQAYANAIAHTMKSHQPSENEAIIAKDALETGNDSRLSDIDPIVAAYNAVRSDLLNTPVPPSAVQYHLNLVNGMSEALANAVSLRNTLTDPLQTLATLSKYQVVEKNFFDTIVNLRSYFSNYGVVFSPTEVAFSVFSPK